MANGLAILCSGQGGQTRDMFRALEGDQAAQGVFSAAASYLRGVDPRAWVRDADASALYSNHAGQILCCTQALAMWANLQRTFPQRIVLAGYSVGELAAWGCAGIFDPAQTLRLAARRAQLMDASSPPGSGLAGIVGLRCRALEAILERRQVFVAIVNASDSFVIGGEAGDLDAAVAEALAKGATTARRLQVAVPSHTVLLDDAATAFAAVLAGETKRPITTGTRLLCGLDGGTVPDPAQGLTQLAAQIRQTIDWSACLETISELQVTAVLELGPGAALSRMAASVMPDLPARSVAEFHTMDGVVRWLGNALRG